jgi:hypothetical protein
MNGEIKFQIIAVDSNNKVREVYKRYFNTLENEKPYNVHWRYFLLDTFEQVRVGDNVDTFGCEKFLGGDV